jgi:hypothetical protein
MTESEFARIRYFVEEIERLFSTTGESLLASRIRNALASPAALSEFVVSNELWGGSGSMADQALMLGSKKLPGRLVGWIVE